MIKKYDSNFRLIWHFLKGSLPFFVLSLISAGMVSFMDMVNPKIVSFVQVLLGKKQLPAAEADSYFAVKIV